MIHFQVVVSSLISLVGAALLTPRSDQKTRHDTALVKKLRSQIRNLPPIKKERSKALSAWNQNRVELREHILNDDPTKFLQWLVVQRTMVASIQITEFIRLRLQNWKQWQALSIENSAGSGQPYLLSHHSSENQLHTIFHLQQLVPTPHLLKEFGGVVEFGGGYGCMCRIFFQSGFDGRYKIFDLDDFSALQQFYLSSSLSNEQVKKIVFANEPVGKRSGTHALPKPTLFIGTWSISETNIPLRNSFLKHVDADAYLIAYQTQFGEVNNARYFSQFRKSKKDIIWKEYSIPHLEGNKYLIGVRANTDNYLLRTIQNFITIN